MTLPSALTFRFTPAWTLAALLCLLLAPACLAQLTFTPTPTPPKLVYVPVSTQVITATLQELASAKAQLATAQAALAASQQSASVSAGQVTTLTATVNTLTAQVTSLQVQLAAGNSSPPGTFGAAYTNTTGKLVFAHYVVSARDYGGSVAGYERDIKDAQAEGIDGFALNAGAWTSGYQTSTANMFAAANALGTGFKLFFSPDLTGPIAPSDVVNMMTTYSTNASYFHYQNRPVLSSYGGNATPFATYWVNGVLTPLRAQSPSVNPYFVPNENPASPAPELATEDGIFNISLLESPINTTPGAATAVSDAQAVATGVHALGKLCMTTVTPGFWGSEITNQGKPFREWYGYEGMAAQWNSILTVQHPDWVECFTWNDFSENTYFSPIDDVCKYWPFPYIDASDNVPGYMPSHAGFARLNDYFIQWYKMGTQPVLAHDEVYWAYRTSFKSVNGSVAGESLPTSIDPNALDDLFVTVLAKSACSLLVQAAPRADITLSVPAGISHYRVPLVSSIGPIYPIFTLSRSGATVATSVGQVVVPHPATINFGEYSGVVIGQ